MEPINIFLVLPIFVLSLIRSLRFENKVIKATAKITPGIAYPEIEKLVSSSYERVGNFSAAPETSEILFLIDW